MFASGTTGGRLKGSASSVNMRMSLFLRKILALRSGIRDAVELDDA